VNFEAALPIENVAPATL